MTLGVVVGSEVVFRPKYGLEADELGDASGFDSPGPGMTKSIDKCAMDWQVSEWEAQPWTCQSVTWE